MSTSSLLSENSLVSFRCPKETIHQMETAAEHLHITRSEWIRFAHMLCLRILELSELPSLPIDELLVRVEKKATHTDGADMTVINNMSDDNEKNSELG